MKIKLRDDGWFEEEEKNVKRRGYVLESEREAYEAKRMLTERLTALNDKSPNRESLEKELNAAMISSHTLELKLYTHANQLFGRISCTQGSVYIGEIVD